VKPDWKEYTARLRQSVLENRFTPGGRRLLILAVLVVLVWSLGLFLQHRARETESRIPLAAGRFASLAETAQAYRAAAPSRSPGNAPSNPADPLAAASETIDRLQIKDRLKSLSSSGRGISLELEGLGQKETLSLVRELKKARLTVTSAEIRALPLGGKRSLSVSLLLGGQP
jgi:hypothetical protein